ncbi:MAG: hypothetical protein KJ970_15130 [Candidatus Eisenbacteria bacterium]|uniref:EF-hand domain-containing protein n=1 Tax=Eiseniibacteriota bacterium TaxID=2212470 RepID=A0A948S1S4_UNCEI|nr:hypothetical protein [Candidatus Eisenbacteria bacterium]MBU1948361.1 hypothetical protein [Candidatus Eisenbacteria bacterium]MBU2692254.1 hypothetical protein [Candidatus Eisenbacteria bacterium]
MKASLLVVLMVLLLGCGDDRASDFEAYIATIRESGMTETAQSQVRMVASIRTGLSVLSFPKNEEEESYFMQYLSGSCPNPEATPDEIQLWRASLYAKLEPEYQELRRLADADQSGFVSTEEATRLRNMYEFGVMVTFVFDNTRQDIPATARGLGLTVEQLRSRLVEYEEYCHSLGAAYEDVMPDADAVMAGIRDETT